MPKSSTAPASIRWASLSDDDYLKYLTELKRIGCPVRTLKDIIEGDVEDLYRPQLAAASEPYWSHSVRARRDVVLKKVELIAFLFAHVEGRDLARFQPADSFESIGGRCGDWNRSKNAIAGAIQLGQSCWRGRFQERRCSLVISLSTAPRR